MVKKRQWRNFKIMPLYMSTNTLSFMEKVGVFFTTYANPLRYIYVLVIFLTTMFILDINKTIPFFEEYHPQVFMGTIAIASAIFLGSLLSLHELSKPETGEPVSILTQMNSFGKMLGIFVLFAAMVYGILFLCIENYEFSSHLLLILIISGVVISSLTFYKYKDKILPDEDSKTNKVLRLIKNIFIYIPCYLSYVGTAIAKELKTAPKEAYILLFLEGIAIVTYVFYGAIKNYMYKIAIRNGKQLLREPIHLNKTETIGSFNELHKVSDKNDTFQYDYSISSWVYLNPDSSTNAYYPILNYGSKPMIEYNQYAHKLRIQMLDGKTALKTIYLTDDIPLQRWNHIVVNYSGSTIDIFINNVLVATKPNIVPYMYYDTIVTGSQENMGGSICNVIYFTQTLSKKTINYMYTMYNGLNPPIL
jgi:hypothetical protein